MAFNPSGTTSAPVIHVTHPPRSLLKFPPAAEPQTLRPPVSDFTIARPFNIDPELYKSLLHVAWPITIAAVYATTVAYLNRANRQRGNKPWALSKTSAFYCFIVLHNLFLAVYSGWTFVGMLNAIRHSWPGWEGEYGIAGAVDALCKLHGPRGLGSAATYNSSTTSWGFTDKALKLAGSSPDTMDVGRIWNEGLAYYGWLFYVSKFYEVVDTLIVLAKGKRSSTLQTYHHAGAMLSMWAGIRYMSPPIWMFVFINSGIHTLMYLYYTLLTLSVPVPRVVKQALTTLQIIQIGFGGTYAMAHLFLAYNFPVSVPYLFVHNLTSAIPAAASSATSAIASATATAGLGSWLKKLALRAAGEEGLAENVRNQQGETFGIDGVHAAEVEKAQEEIRYKMQYQTINCIDTSGQAFAILLNCLYLAPLLLLFVRFFLRTYLRGARAPPPKPSQKQLIQESGRDAAKRIEKEIRDAMDEQGNEDDEIPENVKAKFNDTKSQMQKGAHDLSDKARQQIKKANDMVHEKAANIKGQARKQEAKDKESQNQQSRPQDGWSKSKEEELKPKGEESKPQGEDSKPKADGSEANGKGEDSKKPNEEPSSDSRPPSKRNNSSKKPKEEPSTNDSKNTTNSTKPNDSTSPKNKPNSDSSPQNNDNNQTEDSEDSHPDPAASSYEVNPDDLKTDEEKQAEAEMQSTGEENDGPHRSLQSELDESAYEINADEIQDEEERRAQAEMQPGGN